MKKILNDKKTLIITLAALAVLVLGIIIAVVIKNKNKEDEMELPTPEEEWSTLMMEEGPTGAGEEYVDDGFSEMSEEGFTEEMMMGNPWFDTDKDELEAILGMTFKLPEGATNAAYRMNLAIQMGEVNYDYDGLSYNARIQNTDEYEDISGIYEEWTLVDECDVKGAKGEIMRALHSDTDMVDVITWFDEENHRSYSLSTSGNLDGFDIEAIAEAMYP